jgi:hypothetical protein
MSDMYESPVNIIYGEMQTQIEGDVFKAIQNVGIDVNKKELLKALQYDRGQYEKGYSDGYAKAIDEFAEAMKAMCHGITMAEKHIDNVAEQLKGGAE